ncbi:MAG: hypothetical protein PHI35_08365 [Victivallaceae bacterium]|nr:hypothetical protein [Victivallaceae bacterium]
MTVSVYAADNQEVEKDAPVPVNRTPEDVERGRANVRSVIGELQRLFEDDAPLPQLIPAPKPIEAPYCTVVKGGDGRSTLVFRPRFTTAKEMSKSVDSVITGSALIDRLDEQNVLVLSAPDNEINGYKDLLLAMDVPSPQVLIEAKVVEVLFSEGMQRNLSISMQGSKYSVDATTEVPGQSSQPTNGLGGNFKPITGSNNMNIAFRWLLTAQDAKVLSSPNILISRNEISRIVTGEDIPIQEANSTGNTLQISTTFKNVGVSLEVEPSMINRDNVTLRIYPKVSNVTRYEYVSAGDETRYPVPVIAVRSVETYLRMRNRQVVMMGGLYNSRKTLQEQRVPFLSDMPWIGELFTGKNVSNEVTQLIFFLKIHIISPEQVASGLFYNPDQTAAQSEDLGSIIENSDAIPLHRTSVEKFAEEVRRSAPGAKQKMRDEFREVVILDGNKTSTPAASAPADASKEAAK